MTSITKKLVVVGDGCTGKTCLLDVYNNEELVPNYVPSTADVFKKNLEVDGIQVVLEIWDTNGQEDYDRLRTLSYSKTDVVLICFSVDLRSSLENVSQKWVPDVKRFLPNVPFVLVCNQKDLRSDARTIESLRRENRIPLTTVEGEAVAKQINAFAYLECSAVTKEGVKEVFETAARAALISITKKLVVVGDGMSGKTCLLDVFNNDEFVLHYVPSTSDVFKKVVVVDGKQVVLEIWDTNGQEDYDRLRKLSYPNTDVVLICFSVDLPDSLENVSAKWVLDVKHFMPNVPFVLVCNEKDLRNDAGTIEKLRKQKVPVSPVTTEEGKVVAMEINAFAYVECSALTREGVKEVFETVARATLPSKKKNGCKLS